jgi:hypothetical protein
MPGNGAVAGEAAASSTSLTLTTESSRK